MGTQVIKVGQPPNDGFGVAQVEMEVNPLGLVTGVGLEDRGVAEVLPVLLGGPEELDDLVQGALKVRYREEEMTTPQSGTLTGSTRSTRRRISSAAHGK